MAVLHLLWAKALKIHDKRGYKYFLEEKKKLHQYEVLTASFVKLKQKLIQVIPLGINMSHTETFEQHSVVQSLQAACPLKTAVAVLLLAEAVKSDLQPKKCMGVWRRVY